MDKVKLSNQELALKLLKHCEGMPQVDCPTTHEFADGLYVRKMIAPAGSLVVGKVHRFSTYNVLLRGKAIILTGDGEHARIITAPHTFVSAPEERKAAYFIEESEWLNFHPTEETDLLKIEEKFIIPDTKVVEEEKKLCLG